MAVEVQSDGYGLEWGVQLTAGLRTDITGTTGAYVDDNGAASSYGAQAYLQIVEFAGAVSLNGFLNRWNDTIAPALEAEPIEFGEHYLARHGWSVGKHRP